MNITLHTILTALPSPAIVQAPSVGEDALRRIAVASLCYDSRKAVKGSVFFCLKGAALDGHTFADAAYRNGCRIFVVQASINLPADATVIRVTNTRQAMALAAAAFYGHPADKLIKIGITGTKGKTTTALLIRAALEAAGIPTGYIGTNGIHFGERHMATANSTPESLIIHEHLRWMVNEGMQAVVMEVSSQGLWMSRVHGLDFDTAIFTNLSRDHIGGVEHPDFDHYKECKHTLFTEHHARTVVYNADDSAAFAMLTDATGHPIGVTTAGASAARWAATDIRPSRRAGRIGVSFVCHHDGVVIAPDAFLPLPGVFNVQNALSTLATVCDGCGIEPSVVLEAMAKIVVPGRFETVTHPALPDITFVIDYAHNGVSLTSILDALRAYTPRRLICLFGSVGERTFERRTDLAVAAGHRADLCILTSDNPGREDPLHILEEINAAFPADSCPRELIIDREAAVAHAVSLSRPGDIVLLAGKGHEDYQLIGIEHIPYTERGALAKAFDALPVAETVG